MTMRVASPGGLLRLCGGGAGESDVLSVRSFDMAAACSGAVKGGAGASSPAEASGVAGVASGASAALAELSETAAFSRGAAAGGVAGAALGGPAGDGAAHAADEPAPVACGSCFGGSNAAGTSATRGGR